MSDVENPDFAPVSDDMPPAPVASLGTQLRSAREACGMSIDDVVHALKFSSRQIEAVEADNLGILPGNVFFRGLVRSYARLLKLDPAPLLAMAAEIGPAQEPEIRPPENMGNAAPKGAFSRIQPLVVWSIFLLIAAGAAIGWQFLGGSVGMQPAPLESEQVAVAEPKPVDSTVQPLALVATEPVAAPPVVAPTPAPAVAAAVSETSPVAVPAAPATPVVAPAAPVSPVSAPIVQTAPPPPTDRNLSFSFQGESWIEVKDASGLVILTGIYSSGSRSVVGRAPFEVVIGNAGVVTMRDGGRVVDLAPYARSEVARLTLE